MPIKISFLAEVKGLEPLHPITETWRFSGPLLYQLRQTSWRNGWDSNPQGLLHLYSISNRASLPLEYHSWRRKRDSNPRAAHHRLFVFKTNLFDHLSIPPNIKMYKNRGLLPLGIALFHFFFSRSSHHHPIIVYQDRISKVRKGFTP